jgi:hypothetical protein
VGEAQQEAVVPPARLRARVLERWRVVPTREGLVLVPRQPSSRTQGVELAGDQIYLNGEPVSGGELRSRLGTDAEVVLALSYLDQAARRSLFADEQSQAARPAPGEVEGPAVVVRRGRYGARVRIGGPLDIRAQERVEDAVAVFGSITVEGEVTGDVTAVLGSVTLGPRAIVRGDVTAVGGRIDAHPDARVLGGRNEVAVSWPGDWRVVQIGPDVRLRVFPDREWWARAALGFTSVRLTLLGLLGLAVVLVGGTTYQRARDEASSTPWQALFVGLAAAILLVPAVLAVCGALLVSIIGIPVLALVPVALFVLAVLWLVGFAAVVERVGGRMLPGGSPALAYLAGFVALTALVWLSRLGWWSGTLGFGTATALGAIGLTLEGMAWAAGLGAVLLAWLRRASGSPAMIQPPQPVPQTGGPGA